MLRAIKRRMAKERLLFLGFDRINRRMSAGGIGQKMYKKFAKTWQNRKIRAKMMSENMPLWRSALYGDFAKKWRKGAAAKNGVKPFLKRN